MDQAIGVKDAGRLPWLEPYRPPTSPKGGKRSAYLATGVAALAAAVAVISMRPAADEPLPQAQIVLPAPQDMALDVPPPAVEARSADTASVPVVRPAGNVRKIRHIRPRILTALPLRDAYEVVLSEQIASAILPPAAPVIQPAPAPALPARPAVDPAAEVVKGKTVQLGVYLTQRQAEIAWQSAIRDYTFLVTMPKSITAVRWGAQRKTYYRLQLGTPSKRHARQLCGNLRATGRSCTVA